MAADFNKPTVSNEYTDVPGQIRDNISAAVTAHESDSSSNKPIGAKQITETGVVKRWNGSTWVTIGNLMPNDPLAVANGGTGAATAGDARTNLGCGTAATKDYGATVGKLIEAGSTLSGTGGNRWVHVGDDGQIDIATSNTNRVLTTDASGLSSDPAQGTAFNKNFGTTAGTVAEGDHAHSGTYVSDVVTRCANNSGTSTTGIASNVAINSFNSTSYAVKIKVDVHSLHSGYADHQIITLYRDKGSSTWYWYRMNIQIVGGGQSETDGSSGSDSFTVDLHTGTGLSDFNLDIAVDADSVDVSTSNRGTTAAALTQQVEVTRY